MKKQIVNTLNEYKEYLEHKGHIVFAIALKGSQNYNLADAESDIDANAIIIPTLAQIRSNKAYHYTLETGEIVVHNIYSFADIVSKGNPQWIEVCQSDYVIGDLSMFQHYDINPKALRGMAMQKAKDLTKPLPSQLRYIKELGWAPKQLHHLIRLSDVISNNVTNVKYAGEDRDFMLDVKRGRFPTSLDEALAIRDYNIQLIDKLYQERQQHYSKRPVDYATLDKIVLEELVKQHERK